MTLRADLDEDYTLRQQLDDVLAMLQDDAHAAEHAPLALEFLRMHAAALDKAAEADMLLDMLQSEDMIPLGIGVALPPDVLDAATAAGVAHDSRQILWMAAAKAADHFGY